MARAIRVQFAGAVYHVMARGNERLETEAQEDRKLEKKLAGLRKDLSNVKR